MNGVLRTRAYKKKPSGKLGLSTAYKMFTNTFYYGEFTYGGELYQGHHDKMITREEFDLVQKILGEKGKPRPKSKRLPFNGIIRCGECGGMITCEEKIKFIKSTSKMANYIYHRCTKRKKDIKCSQKTIRTEELQKQIALYLNSITIPEKFMHWTIEVLNEANEIEETERDTIMKNLQTQYQKSVESINNLLKLYISPENADRSLLSDNEYKEQKNNLVREKAKLDNEIEKFEVRFEDWVDLTEKTFNFATYAKKWFEQGDFEIKTNILRCLGQNFVLRDRKLTIDLQKPFLTIKEGLELEVIQKVMLEPEVLYQGKRKNSLVEAAFSQWSG